MKDPPTCFVHGIATAVPERSLNAEESAELLRRACRNPRAAKLLRRVVRLTGIEKRHLAVLDHQLDCDRPLYLPSEEQPDGPGMGARSALFDDAAGNLVCRALGQFSDDTLAGIDALVTCSCTHASSPALDLPIFTRTPVSPAVDRWNLGFMGCSAGLAALRLAHQTAPRRRNTLIVACELSSLHFQYTDALDQLTANVLFSDGAAAAILTPEPSAVRVVDCQCAALPQYADQMVWFADDHGLRLNLSKDLPDTLGKHLPGALERFLEENDHSLADIDHWLVHPGGPQILDSVQAALNLPPEALDLSRHVLRHFGNMSSPTILFILRDLIERKVDGTCVAMAFGPGLTIELALLEIDRGRA